MWSWLFPQRTAPKPLNVAALSPRGTLVLQASELQHLVRDHFDSFVRCADSIEKYASHINMELTNNKEQVKCWFL